MMIMYVHVFLQQTDELHAQQIETRFKHALKQWPRHTSDVPNQPFVCNTGIVNVTFSFHS